MGYELHSLHAGTTDDSLRVTFCMNDTESSNLICDHLDFAHV